MKIGDTVKNLATGEIGRCINTFCSDGSMYYKVVLGVNDTADWRAYDCRRVKAAASMEGGV